MPTKRIHTKCLPSQAYLVSILEYCSATGSLSWKRNKTGQKASGVGWIKDGYRKIGIDRVEYYAHRIIWKMVYSVDPIHIDHINGNREDNRLENLRTATRSENLRNQELSKRNKSGVCGVHFLKKTGRCHARIRGNAGEDLFLGSFEDKEDAISARKDAERDLDYHPNHGRTKI